MTAANILPPECTWQVDHVLAVPAPCATNPRRGWERFWVSQLSMRESNRPPRLDGGVALRQPPYRILPFALGYRIISIPFTVSIDYDRTSHLVHSGCAVPFRGASGKHFWLQFLAGLVVFKRILVASATACENGTWGKLFCLEHDAKRQLFRPCRDDLVS